MTSAVGTGSFLGEYQAGGLILVLGLHTDGRPIVHFFPCTGMHGGKMVFRGDVSSIRFPDQVTLHNATAEDMAEIAPRSLKSSRAMPYTFLTYSPD